MKIKKVNLQQKFSEFRDHWNPRLVGELNAQHVKLARLKGDFIWHQHQDEDEMFLVIEGSLRIELRNQEDVLLNAGEFVVIPKKTEHKPVADEEALVMLFEPAGTLNTGDIHNHLTKKDLEKL